MHHGSEEWYSSSVKISVNDHCSLPAPFYTVLLAVCSAPCTIEEKGPVETRTKDSESAGCGGKSRCWLDYYIPLLSPLSV